MYRLSVLTGLLVLAAPAVAQYSQPSTPQPPASPPAAHAPGHSQPATTTPSAQAPGTAQAPAAAGRPATAAEVESMVTGEFPRRDADGNGNLNQDEFKSWLTELIAAGPGQSATNPAPDLDARIATAFTNTDTDRSNGISPAEMTALLARAR